LRWLRGDVLSKPILARYGAKRSGRGRTERFTPELAAAAQ
jgi:hypothetical protein